LFGHVRGAFTGASADKAGLFEEANGGSLLLDEIGELPAPLQVKLLRVLQEGEIRRVGDAKVRKVGVRVIAATARDLEREVRDGGFREDLYYRLNVVQIQIPPLRERLADLDALVATLLERAMRRSGRQVTLGPDVMAAIRAYPWPGNVRELENAIERAVVLSDVEVLPEAFAMLSSTDSQPGGNEPPTRLSEAVDQAERQAIQRALSAAGGNRSHAARALGVSLRNLFYKIKRLNL